MLHCGEASLTATSFMLCHTIPSAGWLICSRFGICTRPLAESIERLCNGFQASIFRGVVRLCTEGAADRDKYTGALPKANYRCPAIDSDGRREKSISANLTCVRVPSHKSRDTGARAAADAAGGGTISNS